jgi:hypothetical protein
MAAEIVFGGGERLRVSASDAESLVQNLNRAREDQPVSTPSGPIAIGWVDVQTDEGVVLVNPDQVAYVCDVAG